ncbi:MAG TPA: hypothetical protein VGV06_06325 [Methylomirabilota bacterium]|nr:hypothetical protein [Methylomirabilota bacterium]
MAALPYGTWRMEPKAAGFTTGNGRLLHRRGVAGGGPLNERDTTADGNAVVAELDVNGRLRRYEHRDAGRVLCLGFDPPLPTDASAATAESVAYEISLDGFPRLVDGTAGVQPARDGVSIVWAHATPAWTTGYRFTSTVRHTSPGHVELEVAPLLR